MKIFCDASVVVSALRADFEPQARHYNKNLFSSRHAENSAQ
jgi:hypothetical protein